MWTLWIFPNPFPPYVFQFDKYTPKLDNPFIRHSNVSFFFVSPVTVCYLHLANQIFDIFAVKAFTVAVVSCVHMLESCMYLCMILFCVFLCLPSSSSLPSSSPPIPPPCQACPRCSHTQDPSARCKEPSSPRSAPHPYPQPTLYKQAENLIKIAPATQLEKLPRRAHKANKNA